MKLTTTTWQTVGPFFSIGLERLYNNQIADERILGERVEVEGQILDGMGKPIPDCVVEVWQANAHGKYAHPEDEQDKPLEHGFLGFGRISTDDQGYFRFTTVKPGSVPFPGCQEQAPHLLVGITMRGLLRGLVTRAYFEGDPRNQIDPVLALVPAERRFTLMMVPSRTTARLYTWKIKMQGDADETVFFDF